MSSVKLKGCPALQKLISRLEVHTKDRTIKTEVSFHRWEGSLEGSHHAKWLTDTAYCIRFDRVPNPIGSSPFKNAQIPNERLTMGSCNTTGSHFHSTYEHMLVIHPKCKWVPAMAMEKRETYTAFKAWCWHELSCQVQVCQSSDNHLSAPAHEFQHKELLSTSGNIVFIHKGISENNLHRNKEVQVSSDGLQGPLEIFVLKEVPREKLVIKATLAGPLFLTTHNPGEFSYTLRKGFRSIMSLISKN